MKYLYMEVEFCNKCPFYHSFFGDCSEDEYWCFHPSYNEIKPDYGKQIHTIHIPDWCPLSDKPMIEKENL